MASLSFFPAPLQLGACAEHQPLSLRRHPWFAGHHKKQLLVMQTAYEALESNAINECLVWDLFVGRTVQQGPAQPYLEPWFYTLPHRLGCLCFCFQPPLPCPWAAVLVSQVHGCCPTALCWKSGRPAFAWCAPAAACRQQPLPPGAEGMPGHRLPIRHWAPGRLRRHQCLSRIICRERRGRSGN